MKKREGKQEGKKGRVFVPLPPKGLVIVPFSRIEEKERQEALALLIQFSSAPSPPFALGVGGLQAGQPVVWLGRELVSLVSDINSRPCPDTKPIKLASLAEAESVVARLLEANPGLELFPALLYLQAHKRVEDEEEAILVLFYDLLENGGASG